MARRSIEDLDRKKDTELLMDLMYNVRTSDETITCRDNITGSLTDIPYIRKEDRKKEKEEKNKNKSKSNKSKTTPTTSNTSNTT
jgi:hypothetical protein